MATSEKVYDLLMVNVMERLLELLYWWTLECV